MDAVAGILERISAYRRKFYVNQLAKGVIFTAALSLSIYLTINTLEYFGRFDSVVRGVFFFGFLAALAVALFQWVLQPLVHLYGLQKPISDEQAAQQIGAFFPEIGDKLLNTLQLRSLSGTQSDLIEASIRQKSKQLLIVRFTDAIKLNENRKYLKYAIYPLAVIAAILLFNPQFFTSSSDRIINFKQNYNYAPFQFKIENPDLKAFRNEDFTLKVSLVGNALPENVYLVQNKARFKLEPVNGRAFEYTFKNLQREVDFRFDAAGFQSNDYKINVADRPSLLSFDVTLNYPGYLNKPSEQLANVGNLTVPEGTTISWDFNTTATEALTLQFEGDAKRYEANAQLTGGFDFRRSARKSGQYQIDLRNDETQNREKISYFVNVIPDKFPILTLENYQDTTLYNYFVLGGNIADDYGFTQLKVSYNVLRNSAKGTENKGNYRAFNVPFNKSINNQTFYFQWYTDSLKLAPGDKIEYFAQVWDNDGVNGPKAAKSRIINFTVPSKDLVNQEIDKSAEKTEKQIDKVLNKAENLQKELEKLDQRLKSQKELDYQEKKQIEDVIKKREELENEIRSMQQQNQITQQKQQRFAQQNPELMKKLDQLQKMMDQMLDPETKKLYEELKKMLEQKQQDDKMFEMMNRLKNKEFNLQKEVQRAQELFKKMKMEQKLDQVIKDLEAQAEKQDKLAEETEKNAKDQKEADKKDPKADKKNDKTDKDGKDQKDGKDGKDSKEQQKKQDELKKEQEQLNKEFEKTKKDVDEAEKMNKELEKPEELDPKKEEQEQIDKEQEESMEQMEQNQNKGAAKSQKKAAKAMRAMSAGMMKAKMGADKQEAEEDMEALRAILENLIQLSYDQERVMKDFKGVSLQDPRFVKLAQEQLKIQDDSKVVEDSLYALAKRVMQIQTFVTRELADMKYHSTESSRYIRERKIGLATSKQQFAMTSMNNLAAMLSDVFKQMQQQMQAMAMPGGGGKGKQKGKSKSPGQSLGEMQEKLNGQMQKMKGQGKGGKGGEMSEQLAKMAAEQGRIRRQLQELMDSQKGSEGGNKVGDQVRELMRQMDETETDLVNKRLTEDLLKRQQDIQTRLLESEKALREQEEDNKRKSETAQQIQRRPPAAFEQYVKEKQKQTELLRTVPPTFSPFYKREVDTYFKKYQK